MSDALDFRAAVARLEAIGRVIEGGRDLTRERTQQILEQRARRWAPAPAGPPTDCGTPVVVFRAAGYSYAVEPSCVREVLRACLPTPLPGAHPYVSGVIHHRGEVLAVIELGALAGHTVAAGTDRLAPTPVVVVEAPGTALGIRADSMPEIGSALADWAGPANAGAPGGLPGSVRRTAAGVLMLLDLEALASDPRVVIEEASR